MRWKVENVENEAGRTISLKIAVWGRYDAHDRKQKPLSSDLDDPRYGLKAVQRALVARPVNRVHGQIETAGTHIDATTSDYGLLHNNPVRENENVISWWQRGKKSETHMLSMPDAEEVLPRRRNHGLNPSDEPLEMMR